MTGTTGADDAAFQRRLAEMMERTGAGTRPPAPQPFDSNGTYSTSPTEELGTRPRPETVDPSKFEVTDPDTPQAERPNSAWDTAGAADDANVPRPAIDRPEGSLPVSQQDLASQADSGGVNSEAYRTLQRQEAERAAAEAANRPPAPVDFRPDSTQVQREIPVVNRDEVTRAAGTEPASYEPKPVTVEGSDNPLRTVGDSPAGSGAQPASNAPDSGAPAQQSPDVSRPSGDPAGASAAPDTPSTTASATPAADTAGGSPATSNPAPDASHAASPAANTGAPDAGASTSGAGSGASPSASAAPDAAHAGGAPAAAPAAQPAAGAPASGTPAPAPATQAPAAHAAAPAPGSSVPGTVTPNGTVQGPKTVDQTVNGKPTSGPQSSPTGKPTIKDIVGKGAGSGQDRALNYLNKYSNGTFAQRLATNPTGAAGKGLSTGAKDAAKGAYESFKAAGKFAKVMKLMPVLGAVGAISDFADGRWVKGTIGLLGLIPGPIGWAFTAVYMIWTVGEWLGWFGGNKIGMWDEPDGTNTFILPGTAKDIDHVDDLDRVLTDLNKNKIFGMTDGPQGQIWRETPLPATRVDTDEVKTAIANYFKECAEQAKAVRTAIQNSGEPKITAQLAGLNAHLSLLEQLPDAAKVFDATLKNCSDAAENAYKQVTETNKAARTQLSNDGALSDNSQGPKLIAAMTDVENVLDKEEEKLAKLLDQAPAAAATVVSGTPTKTPSPKKVETPTPKPITSTPSPTPSTNTPAGPAKTETPEKKNTDDLANALKGLQSAAKQATPNTPSMPNLSTPQMPNLGGSNPLGNQGQNPLANLGDKLNEKKPEEKKDEPIKKREEPKKPDLSGLNNKVKPVEQKPEVKPEAAPAAVAPAATVPGENKKPEEENKTPKPGAPKPNTTVDMKGTKVEFPNERVARMADLLGKADAEHPLTLTDAAAEAGLKPPVAGQDPGEQIPPTKAKPGDLLVAGDRQFLFLGDDKFYTDDYKVVSGSEVPELGDKGGWFHLPDDPNAAATDKGGDQGGQGSGGQGPVSGPAEGGTKVENPAAGVETKPTPGTGDQGGSGQSGSGSGSGTPMPGSPSAKPGVTSSGEPGAPVQGGSGPGGTSGTNTGNGQGGSNSGSKPLDSAGIL